MTSARAFAAATSERSSPVRLLTLTTLFPNATRPRHGIFIANRLRRLCATGRVASTVVAPVPWFPGAYRASLAVPREECRDGVRVLHPRYLHVPGIGMRLQPASLAHTILSTLDREGLGRHDFDVLDAHYFYPDGVTAARLADALRLPLVISARGSDINLIGDIAFARRAMVRAAERAQALIAVSQALAGRMKKLGMPAERIQVLRNGVDLDLFRPCARAEARARLGLPLEVPLIVGVGNLVPEKRFDLLVRALAGAPSAHLLLVGEGGETDRTREIANEVAPGRVRFLPNVPQSELRFVYAAADVLGLPSVREGWPNVLLEAMACGTPVAAAAVGGVPEILRPNAPGTLVTEPTPEAWSAALRGIIAAAHPAERVRAYASDFGWDEVIAQQCALYEDVRVRWSARRDGVQSEMASAHA